MKLQGKNALITGASRGIGREIALEFARNGANVAVNYVSNEERANEVVDEISKMDRIAYAVQGDVADSNSVSDMVRKTMDYFGNIDILVNNAGILRDSMLLKMTEHQWDEVINTNLKGVFLCTQAVAQNMVNQKSGRIINISSVVGVAGNIGQTNYVAAKAGMIGMTKTLAMELARYGITANVVAPGFIRTDLTNNLRPDVIERSLKRIPLGVAGEPIDIANSVVFLASDEGRFITGQTIHVNGGRWM